VASPPATASVARVTAASGRAIDRWITSAPNIASSSEAMPRPIISSAVT